MKNLKLLPLLLFSLCLSFSAYAQGGIYGVNVTASLGTEDYTTTSSGTTVSLHTVPITNKTITEAVFATGTTGAAKASDLAVVFDGGNVAVINTASNDILVATIAQGGSNSSLYTSVITGKVKTGATNAVLNATEVEPDFEFTIPGEALQTTAARITAKVREPDTAISGLFMTFFGGSTSGTDTYIEGSVKQNGKVY